MALIAFDTLKYASRLEKSGFERKQAVELAEAQAEVLSDLMQEKLATKEDLRETKIALQAQIQEVRTELHGVKTELQAQTQEVKVDLQAQMHQLALQLKEIQNTLIRWMIGLVAGGVGILSFLLTALKLFS